MLANEKTKIMKLPYLRIKEPVDYEKLSNAYKKAKWSWHKIGIPSAEEVKQTCSMLKDELQEPYTIAESGGIAVQKVSTNTFICIDKRIHKYYVA